VASTERGPVHKRLETTALYTHVATEVLRKVISPLESLPPS
jgi:site-specific recombinase XerD